MKNCKTFSSAHCQTLHNKVGSYAREQQLQKHQFRLQLYFQFCHQRHPASVEVEALAQQWQWQQQKDREQTEPNRISIAYICALER